MHAKTMEGLVGAGVNKELSKTPMRVFKEARRKGDVAGMERAMGYVGDCEKRAGEYQTKAEEGMKEDAKDVKQAQKAAREKAIENQKEDKEKLEEKTEAAREDRTMRISSYDTDYKSNYVERVQARQDEVKESDSRDRADSVKDREEKPAANQERGFPAIKDEYIGSEESGRKVSGLYSLEQDKSGNQKVRYDAPKKDGKGKNIRQGEGSAREAEECTGSTDKVDREIEKLKEQKKQLEQQIKAADGNEKKVKELERKLSQVETELNRKDNDAYRKRNMVVS